MKNPNLFLCEIEETLRKSVVFSDKNKYKVLSMYIFSTYLLLLKKDTVDGVTEEARIFNKFPILEISCQDYNFARGMAEIIGALLPAAFFTDCVTDNDRRSLKDIIVESVLDNNAAVIYNSGIYSPEVLDLIISATCDSNFDTIFYPDVQVGESKYSECWHNIFSPQIIINMSGEEKILDIYEERVMSIVFNPAEDKIIEPIENQDSLKNLLINSASECRSDVLTIKDLFEAEVSECKIPFVWFLEPIIIVSRLSDNLRIRENDNKCDNNRTAQHLYENILFDAVNEN